MIVALLFVTFLVAVTAFYVGAEFAAVSARRSRVAKQAEEGNRVAIALLPHIDNPEGLDGFGRGVPGRYHGLEPRTGARTGRPASQSASCRRGSKTPSAWVERPPPRPRRCPCFWC